MVVFVYGYVDHRDRQLSIRRQREMCIVYRCVCVCVCVCVCAGVYIHVRVHVTGRKRVCRCVRVKIYT